MRFLLMILFSFGFGDLVFAGEETKTVSFFDKGLTLEIPINWGVLSNELKAIKYPRGNVPEIIYTDDTAKINVLVNRIDYPLDSFSAHDMAVKVLEGLRKIRNIQETFSVGSEFVNGMELGVIEFKTPALESETYGIYNSMALVFDGDFVFLINFNCTTDFGSKCFELGKAIKESIRLIE